MPSEKSFYKKIDKNEFFIHVLQNHINLYLSSRMSGFRSKMNITTLNQNIS